jgi:hypothetical protein
MTVIRCVILHVDFVEPILQVWLSSRDSSGCGSRLLECHPVLLPCSDVQWVASEIAGLKPKHGQLPIRGAGAHLDGIGRVEPTRQEWRTTRFNGVARVNCYHSTCNATGERVTQWYSCCITLSVWTPSK